jgi:hypothetical protein
MNTNLFFNYYSDPKRQHEIDRCLDNNKRVFDNVFILMDLKRSGEKPIWNPMHRKHINLDKLYNCIYTISNNLLNGI